MDNCVFNIKYDTFNMKGVFGEKLMRERICVYIAFLNM